MFHEVQMNTRRGDVVRFDRSSMTLLFLALGGCAAPNPIRVDRASLFADQDAKPPVGVSPSSSPTSGGPSVLDASNPIAPEPAPLVAEPPAAVSEGSDGAAGQWEFVLNGSGASDKKLEQGGLSATGSLGFYLSDHFELAVRQSVLFAASDAGGSSTSASTRAALDIVFGSGSFRPILGVNGGRVYGDAVTESWVGGPEAGFKIYVEKDGFLQLLAEDQFFFRSSHDIDDQFDDRSLVDSLRVRVDVRISKRNRHDAV